jgi:hypothetical protein
MYAHDVWVLELCQFARLFKKSAQCNVKQGGGLIARPFEPAIPSANNNAVRRQLLDHDPLLKVFVAAEVCRAKASLPKDPLDDIFENPTPYGKRFNELRHGANPLTCLGNPWAKRLAVVPYFSRM